MIENIFIFAVSFFLIFKGATLSTKYAFNIARSYKLSKYVVGFIIVSVISIIPEVFISVNSAIEKVPSLGLGALFGGNIADMTLVFAIIIFVSGRGIKVDSKILKENVLYPLFLIIPIFLGLDGFYSRLEGLTLIVAGIIFYYLALRNNKEDTYTTEVPIDNNTRRRDMLLFLLTISLLIIGSHFIVTSAVILSNYLGVNQSMIGIIIIGVGTTMPELFFCLSAVKKNHDSLAVGDILGTVLADATIVVGLLALISPFAFPQKIIYSTGIFMILSSFLLFYFMRSGKFVSKKESYFLFLFWLLFVFVEIVVSR